jgi:hypothetical protein
VNKAGAADSNIDYGNGFFNDHHFHYGYFLTVAAVIGKYDGAWLTAHRDTINFFARYVTPCTVYFGVKEADGCLLQGHHQSVTARSVLPGDTLP